VAIFVQLSSRNSTPAKEDRITLALHVRRDQVVEGKHHRGRKDLGQVRTVYG
jgi:hypothetical protein